MDGLKEKRRQSEKLARDTQAFLASGGRIDYRAPGDTGAKPIIKKGDNWRRKSKGKTI